jgi:hypothetical protein
MLFSLADPVKEIFCIQEVVALSPVLADPVKDMLHSGSGGGAVSSPGRSRQGNVAFRKWWWNCLHSWQISLRKCLVFSNWW